MLTFMFEMMNQPSTPIMDIALLITCITAI